MTRSTTPSRPWRMHAHSRLAALALTLLLAACGGGGGGGGGGDGGDDAAEIAAELHLDAMDPANWEIGPIINGRNLSTGMPLHPSALAGAATGWVVDLPSPSVAAGSAHYLTMPTGSLANKSVVRMRFRVEAAPGVTIEPRTAPGSPAILTLYFQRAGDNWSARDAYETFRWYATFSSHLPIRAGGEYTVEARFDQNWTAVLTSSRATQPTAFRDALAGAGRIGFVLGGGDGYGHGVYATGPARLIVTSFEVE